MDRPYDASGDVTYDGVNYYSYDAEGRVCAVQTYSILGGSPAFGYLYDAEGTRVAKGSITPSPNPLTQPSSCDPTTNGFQFTENYVLGPGGEELSMLDGNNNWQRTNVYAAGKLVGTYDTLGLHFHLEDPLGTRRMQLSGNPNSVGQPETDIQSMPYGDQLNSYTDQYAPATADDATPLYFTGKERDAESGNDYFEARYYSSAMGRFMSPDWSAKEEPVPYAQLADPQSLNLYSYVRNNPLIRVDADGHDFIKDQNQQWIIDHQISNPDAGLMAAAGVHKLSGSNDDAPKDHFASVSDWSKSAGGFHHVGLAVDSDDTHGFSTNDPSTPGWKRIFGAPKARMEDDLDMHTKNGEVAPHSYMHIPITAGQAKAIQAAIDARRMSHP